MAHRGSFRRGSPSLKTWFGQGTPATGEDIAGSALSFSGGNKFFGTPFSDDVTVLRTRGSALFTMSGNLDVDLLPANTFSVAIGIGLCTEEASLAGAFPLPYDNPDWDGWFYYETRGMEPFGTSRTGFTTGFRASWEIDSKAMRKIQGGMVLGLATQVYTGDVDAAATRTIRSIVSIRALLKTS